jgi:hypothetical protein
MRKYQLLASTGYRPSVRLGKHGHPMRDPDGAHGHQDTGGTGGDSNGGGNNGGGNGGNNGSDTGNAGNPGNNSGGGFDPAAFWNEPEAEESGSGNQGGSVTTNPPGNQDGNGGGNAFANALNSMTFGQQGVFTPEAVEAMNNGDSTTFNNNMTTFGREVTRQAVVMAAQLMQRHGTELEQKFQSMIEGRLGQRDTETDLAREIPSYGDPKAGIKPVVDGLMVQALKLTKGKRPEAIAMTKQMLQFQATRLGSDFGITTPPGGAGDNQVGQTNWEEELLGRG